MTAVQKRDFKLFIGQLRAYLRGEGTNPAIKVPDSNIEVCFENPVAKEIAGRPYEFGKEFRAIRLGYIGNSDGGRNGIVDLREEDSRMRKRLDTFRTTDKGRELLQTYCIECPQLVKIVVHKKNGERVIGFFDKTRSKAVFTHQMAYTQ